jgi:hypothetical protein
MDQFPPSPRVFPLGPFQIFLLPVKVHHRYKRHRRQIFPPVDTSVLNLPPVSSIPAANLQTVSTTPVANCHRFQQDTGGKFATGVKDTGVKQ